jgi:ribosomal protein L40E
MALDPLRLLNLGIRVCRHCGAVNARSARRCDACDERLRAGNPIVRALVGLIGLAVVGMVILWQLR